MRLYDLLEQLQPSPIISLNRAVAGCNGRRDPRLALALIDLLASELNEYHLLHAARADLLRRMGSRREAAESYERALLLVTNESERRFLERRLREVKLSDTTIVESLCALLLCPLCLCGECSWNKIHH